MLLVTVYNIDGDFAGVFDTSDKVEAVKLALDQLKGRFGFFSDTRVIERPNVRPEIVGFVYAGEDDPDEINDAANDENTYWVDVVEYTLGTMF